MWCMSRFRSRLLCALAISGAFATAAAGALLVPRWFWVPLGIVAVAAGTLAAA